MMIGIGCDIVEIKRVRIAITKPGFLAHLLSDAEQTYCANMKPQRKAEWVAGRFAAKEAIYKAIHTVYDGVATEIEILCAEDGAPYCTLKEYEIQVSIAHEREYAIAYAIACTKE